MKSDAPTDESNMPKKDPCAPTPTLIPVFAPMHICGLVVSDTVRSAEASRFRNMLADAMPPNPLRPTSSCGMR